MKVTLLIVFRILRTVLSLHQNNSSIDTTKRRVVLVPIHQTLKHNITESHHHDLYSHLVRNRHAVLLRFPATNQTTEKNRVLIDIGSSSSSKRQRHSFISLASCTFIFTSLLRKTIMKSYRRMRKAKEQKNLILAAEAASSDIVFSAIPANFGYNYGSFSSPWNGGLDKFDV